MLESQLQSFLAQKQTAEIELNEINNALEEIKNVEEVYKITAGFMIRSDKIAVEKDLQEKKKVLDLRLESLEKQEKLLETKASQLRSTINSQNS